MGYELLRYTQSRAAAARFALLLRRTGAARTIRMERAALTGEGSWPSTLVSLFTSLESQCPVDIFARGMNRSDE